MSNLSIGAINPYALAEIMLHRRVAWDRIRRPEQLLEEALGLPYAELFEMKYDSPIFAGLRMGPEGLAVPVPKAELAPVLERPSRMTVRPREFAAMFERMDVAPLPSVLREVALPGLEVRGANQPWSPEGVDWIDKGDFFEEGTEAGDPQQGALGDCYLIAALGSVGWARPFVISHVNRRTGNLQQAFVDRVVFHDTSNGNAPVPIEVTEKVPVNESGHGWRYARSTESGEIWPAVYEKAYAKWKTGTTTDQPEYPDIAGGDPVRACAELIGGSRTYKWTKDHTGTELYDYVRAHCRGRRTFDPMVAWTYGSSPDGLDYSAAKVVGNHAYSVLGWAWSGGERYIVMRNPWATHHAVLDTLGGSWWSQDISYNRVDLLNANGVFAMKADTVQKYFAGLGHSA